MTPHAHAVAVVVATWSVMAVFATATYAVVRRLARAQCPLCRLGVPDHTPFEVIDLDA